MMPLSSPTLPAPGSNPAGTACRSPVPILPDASPDALGLSASPRTRGEINGASLCATVAVEGTHAGIWTRR